MNNKINSFVRIICFIDIIYSYYVLILLVDLIRYDFKFYYCWHGFIICYLLASCVSFSYDFKKELKMKKEKNKKLPFKQRIFNKVLEKPINDILYVTYELYHNSCRVYLDEENIPSLEEFSQIVNNKLKDLYNGGVESC